jgi:methyl-accepting chemotaxis protein
VSDGGEGPQILRRQASDQHRDGLLQARSAQLQFQRNAKAAVVALCLLLGAYLFYCFARVMSGGRLVGPPHLDNMADGDLTRAPRPWGNDEAAQLMTALARMQASMAMIVRGFIEPIARELPMEYALELNKLIEMSMEGSVG